MENAVKLNQFSRRTSTILCLGLLFTLSSCSVLQDQSNSAARTPAAGRVQPTTSTQAEQKVIPELASANVAAQQALIDAINRDGQRQAVPGFRDPIPATVDPAGENIVSLNYEQAELRLVLEELARALNITLVIDPTIDNVVSIRTPDARPLTREDIWPLMQLLVRDAGVVLERAGNVYNARRSQSILPVEITSPAGLGQTVAARLMQITPLTYVSAQAAMEALAPLLEPDGNARKLSNINTLAITGSEFQLERINQLLALIDADPFANQGIRLFQLVNANAEEVAAELTEILQLIEGPTPAYQVKGIERINALLITAPATRGFDEILRWVRILDADSQEQIEQLFQYRVKNLNAEDLAATLSKVFERDESEISGTQPVPQIVIPGIMADGGASGSQQGIGISANLAVRIVANEGTNSLLIRSTARDYRQLLTTINQLDAVPLQVMVNAVIAQVTLTEATKFGIDWSRVARDTAVDQISTQTRTGFLPAGGLGGLMFSKAFIDGAAQIDATLEAIATDNDVNLLARPSLTVINNQEAEIQIGAQVPVQLGEESTSNGNLVSNFQYRDTGIVLSITPQINNDGVINLIIRQELSSVDRGAAGVGENPVFNNQEINTTVVVRDRENVVLGGLIQTVTESLSTGVPGLSKIPMLGRLFTYNQDNIERRELFIVLRPEIINLNEQANLEYQEILDRFDRVSELIEAAGI